MAPTATATATRRAMRRVRRRERDRDGRAERSLKPIQAPQLNLTKEAKAGAGGIVVLVPVVLALARQLEGSVHPAIGAAAIAVIAFAVLGAAIVAAADTRARAMVTAAELEAEALETQALAALAGRRSAGPDEDPSANGAPATT